MSQNQAANSSISILKWMNIDNLSKQICSSHNWNILFSFMKSKNCVFHVSFNMTSRCRCSVEDLMFFVGNSIPSYSLSFACKNCLCCLVKDLPEINSIYHPRKNFTSASPSKTYVPYINMTLHPFVNSLTYG